MVSRLRFFNGVWAGLLKPNFVTSCNHPSESASLLPVVPCKTGAAGRIDMHKVKFVLILGAALGLSATCLSAQDQSGQPQPGQPQPGQSQGGGHHRRGGQVNTDKMLARMTQKLNLSADQQSQLKPILADRQKQIQALRADSSLTPDDRRAKGKQVMQATNGQIEGILNDQQKQQWQQMKDERGEHHKGH